MEIFTACVEFVQLLSSEANDVCEKECKKTITPEHVLKALNELGLGSRSSAAKPPGIPDRPPGADPDGPNFLQLLAPLRPKLGSR